MLSEAVRDHKADPWSAGKTRPASFYRGVLTGNRSQQCPVAGDSPLVIEALITEYLIPFAKTSSLGRFDGGQCLDMVKKNPAWIDRPQEKLSGLVAA